MMLYQGLCSFLVPVDVAIPAIGSVYSRNGVYISRSLEPLLTSSELLILDE